MKCKHNLVKWIVQNEKTYHSTESKRLLIRCHSWKVRISPGLTYKWLTCLHIKKLNGTDCTELISKHCTCKINAERQWLFEIISGLIKCPSVWHTGRSDSGLLCYQISVENHVLLMAMRRQNRWQQLGQYLQNAKRGAMQANGTLLQQHRDWPITLPSSKPQQPWKYPVPHQGFDRAAASKSKWERTFPSIKLLRARL